MPLLARTLCLLSILSVVHAARADAPPARPPDVIRFSLDAPATPLPLPLSLRLQFLERTLEGLGRHDAARVLNGSLLLALGAGFGVSAVFVREPLGRALFALGGATVLGRGVLRLSLSTHAAQGAALFFAMPAADLAQAERKLAFGEAALARVAHVQRRARILDGTLGMLAAGSFVPLCWALNRHADASYRFGQQSFDYVGLSLSVIALAASLVQALVASDAERDHARYRALP